MRRFIVDYRFSGRGSTPIQADSLDDAESMVEAQIEDEGFEPPVDDYDDIDFDIREMHPVTRDGHEVWTTYPRASDTRGHASAIKDTPLFSGSD